MRKAPSLRINKIIYNRCWIVSVSRISMNILRFEFKFCSYFLEFKLFLFNKIFPFHFATKF